MKKIAVHCKTQEEWKAAKAKCGLVPEVDCGEKDFADTENQPCIILDKLDWNRKFFFDRDEMYGHYSLIPASEYLSEWEQVEDVETLWEFKVGDSVEVVEGSEDYGYFGLTLRKAYTVREANPTHIKLNGSKLSYFKERFELIKPNKTIREEKAKEVDFDEILEEVCKSCDVTCNASNCEGATKAYLEDNNLTIKKETKVMDAAIRKEFGKEEGDTLLNVDEHFTPDVMRRMFMKKNHKDIVAECDHIQREKEMREAEDKS